MNLGRLCLACTLALGGQLSAEPAATHPTTTASTPATLPAPKYAASAPAPAAPLSRAAVERIDALVQKLNSDNWQDRQAAQDGLTQLGEDVIPRLREIGDHASDEEVRARAKGAMRMIEEMRRSGQSLVTLHLKDASPKIVFQELARQAHTELNTWPPKMWEQQAWPTITLEMDQVPFWTAMQEVCTKLGVQLQTINNERFPRLMQGSNGAMASQFTAVSGAFLVVAKTIQRSNTVDLSQPKNVQHSFYINFFLFPEPKLHILQYMNDIHLDEAVDEKGHSLLLGGPSYQSMNTGASFPFNMTARLNYPENAGSTIKKLKGSMRFMVQTRSDTLEIPDVLNAANAGKPPADHRLKLKQVTRNGQQYSVEVDISHVGLDDTAWQNLQMQPNQIQLLDAKGRPLISRGWGSRSDNGSHIVLTLQFSRETYGDEDSKPGEPAKLVWEIPTETKMLDVPFELTDLPLP